MKQGQKITKKELQEKIKSLSEIFDIVRVVDPYRVNVLDDELKYSDLKNTCYNIWKKNGRCSNCISMKAYTEFERRTKYEFRDDKAFFVLVMPYMLADDNDRIVVLEMVNDVSEEITVKAEGRRIVANSIREIDEKLYTDSLTGIYNRRYFDENMFMYQNKKALSGKVGFILLDLKNFKEINDTYGHSAGDNALRQAAEVMTRYTRKDDVVIRLGGDEYLIVMQNCLEVGVKNTAMRIKEKIREIEIFEHPEQRLEINAGYAYTDHFDATKKMIHQMYQEADKYMYRDKHPELKQQTSCPDAADIDETDVL